LLALANSMHPSLLRRGGGARDIEIRLLPPPEGSRGEPILVVHILIDCREAMGANLINTVAEGVAPLLEQITGGRVYLRILSNLADRRLARAMCRIPVAALADFDLPGEDIAEGISQASRFAVADPYRAVTHNKGVMNGIDAVAIATGNDWRAIEAAAHAWAAKDGVYRSLTQWTVDGEGRLAGKLSLPLKVGIVGGSLRANPAVEASFALLGVESATELAGVMGAVGLAQNLAALRALVTHGIQKGHMRLHARSVAGSIGTPPEHFERLVQKLVASGDIKVRKARE